MADKVRLSTLPTKFVVLTLFLMTVPRPSWGGAPAAQQPKAVENVELPKLAFSVASIRESWDTLPFAIGAQDPIHSGSFTATNVTFHDLVETAYDLEDFQLLGETDWEKTVRFNIRAVSEPDVDAKLAKLDDVAARSAKQHMLQDLLADRFKLVVKHGSTITKSFTLTVSGNGSKLARLADSSKPQSGEEDNQRPLYQRGDGTDGYELVCKRCTLDMFAELLTDLRDRPVRNRTKLTGTYTFNLKYRSIDASSTDTDDMSGHPSLVGVIEEKLGLLWAKQRTEASTLTIQKAELPTPN